MRPGCAAKHAVPRREVLRKSYNELADVWSVGVVAYACVCGCPPFAGACEREVLRRVREGVASFASQSWQAERARAPRPLMGRVAVHGVVGLLGLGRGCAHASGGEERARERRLGIVIAWVIIEIALDAFFRIGAKFSCIAAYRTAMLRSIYLFFVCMYSVCVSLRPFVRLSICPSARLSSSPSVRSKM